MASTDAEVCNIALGRIGQGQFITALTDPGVVAQACAVFFPTARDTLLELLPWPFANTRALLAVLDATVVSFSGWDFAYSLPTDCVFARYLYPGVESPAEEQRIPFHLERDATLGKVLVTNKAAAELIYTARVTDVQQYPALFVDALAWRLAVDLTMRLPVKPQLALAIERKAQMALQAAGASVLRQAQASPLPEGRYIRARG